MLFKALGRPKLNIVDADWLIMVFILSVIRCGLPSRDRRKTTCEPTTEEGMRESLAQDCAAANAIPTLARSFAHTHMSSLNEAVGQEADGGYALHR